MPPSGHSPGSTHWLRLRESPCAIEESLHRWGDNRGSLRVGLLTNSEQLALVKYGARASPARSIGGGRRPGWPEEGGPGRAQLSRSQCRPLLDLLLTPIS